MSGKITRMPSRDGADYICICICGCATFELRGNGEIWCAACGQVTTTEDDHSWYRKPVSGDLVSAEPNFFYGDNGSSDLTEAMVKRDATRADWIVHGTLGGEGVSAVATTWGRTDMIETEDHRAWFIEQVQGAADRLKDRIAKVKL